MAHMDFEINVWRGYYDQIQALGAYLKDSRPDVDGVAPKFTITLSERHKLEGELVRLTNLCDKYLDKCRIHPREALWPYDRTNETTWASSEKFKYSHLMPKRRYVRVQI